MFHFHFSESYDDALIAVQRSQNIAPSLYNKIRLNERPIPNTATPNRNAFNNGSTSGSGIASTSETSMVSNNSPSVADPGADLAADAVNLSISSNESVVLEEIDVLQVITENANTSVHAQDPLSEVAAENQTPESDRINTSALIETSLATNEIDANPKDSSANVEANGEFNVSHTPTESITAREWTTTRGSLWHYCFCVCRWTI